MDPKTHIINNQISFKVAKVILKNSKIQKALLVLTVTKDGSLVIDPSTYFEAGNWRYGIFRIPQGRFKDATISMKENTKIEHPTIGPKFTYHKSGIVTVSRTGKLEQRRSQATPLNKAQGHIFTIMAKGFDAFKDTDLNNKKYSYIVPKIDNDTKSIKIVGSVGRLEDFVTPRGDRNIPNTPNVRFVKEVGDKRIEVSLFRLRLTDDSFVWIQLEYWLNFPYNLGNEDPSISILTGWDTGRVLNYKKSFAALGIIGGK